MRRYAWAGEERGGSVGGGIGRDAHVFSGRDGSVKYCPGWVGVGVLWWTVGRCVRWTSRGSRKPGCGTPYFTRSLHSRSQMNIKMASLGSLSLGTGSLPEQCGHAQSAGSKGFLCTALYGTGTRGHPSGAFIYPKLALRPIDS